ncbi:uncharacterized protein LOC144662377 [Oculina patagonica]
MTCIDKIVLAFVIVQVAVVLAKPYDPVYDDGQFHSNDDMENFFHKRATDCGSGCEHEGCYSQKCHSSCLSGQMHVSMYDNKCSSGTKCCMCHTGWGGSDCVYEG